MSEMKNPFTMRGTIQDPSSFIGRANELNKILNYLKDMQSCSVIGERRIGKSSLLYNLYQTGNERIGDSSFRFVYIELTDARAQTVVDFLHTILQMLELSIDEIVDENKPNKNLMIFDDVIKKIHEKGQRVILCLDEFEGFLDNPGEFDKKFFRHFRTMINQRRLALVTSSLQPLDEYFKNENPPFPFHNLFTKVVLGNISNKDVEDFICFYQHQVNFTEKELQFISWYLDEPHPLKMQIFCDMVLQWREYEDEWTNDVVLQRISSAYKDFLGEKHDWTKWNGVSKIFSADNIGKWLANVKTVRDLAAGK